jgi:predicted Fe-Mo cluster-binding NifX family protein
MKAALTVWDGRISPVFDVSREALVITLKDGAVVARRMENIAAPTAALKLDRLAELGIEALVCGAISAPLHHELTTRGVSVTGFVAGEIEEVLASFLAGRLPTPDLSMPGCCGRQDRFRGGRGQGGRRGVGPGGGGRSGGQGVGRGGGWGRTGRP